MAADDMDADILRVPSPPQRRLSRSSIDLRDLEQQQQLQSYDRVVHTDSAPSVIALENFYHHSKNGGNNCKNKSTDSGGGCGGGSGSGGGFFQPIISKTNFLNKPLECFHTRLNNNTKKLTNAIDTLTIESDNEDLARFIEDNYQYFKKQNGSTDQSTAESTTNANMRTESATVAATVSQNLQACSDPDFLTLKNNIDCCDSCAATATKIKSKKHKIAALSDSDFIVSFGNKSKKFTLKSKVPFKTILNGKFSKANKYNSLDHATTAAVDGTTSAPAAIVTVPSTITSTISATIVTSVAAAADDITSTTASVAVVTTTAATTTTTTIAPKTVSSTTIGSMCNKKYTHTGLNNHLSQSLNGCYHNKKNDQSIAQQQHHSKSFQRVLSEGNETATHTTTDKHTSSSSPSSTLNSERYPMQRFHQSHDAFDMFVKLFQCEKNNKNMCDRQSSTNKFNYKIVVNSKEYDYYPHHDGNIYGNFAPSSIGNASVSVANATAAANTTTIAAASNSSQSAIAHSDSMEKLFSSMDDGAKSNNELSSSDLMGRCMIDSNNAATAAAVSAASDRLVIVNHPHDENLLCNLNADAGLHTGHVLVNNLVITSPPVTPKQLLSPKTINKEQQQSHQSHSPQNCFSYSQHHLSPHMLNTSDTTSISMDLVANNTPHTLEQLVSLRSEITTINDNTITTTTTTPTPIVQDLKVRSASSTTLNNGNAATEQNFIKNDLALINSKAKCDKNNSCGIVANNANVSGGGNAARIRKPSVTYDINVINKSQDFNIDDICPQRSSYAARSGSTTSTSECEANLPEKKKYTITLYLFRTQIIIV